MPIMAQGEKYTKFMFGFMIFDLLEMYSAQGKCNSNIKTKMKYDICKESSKIFNLVSYFDSFTFVKQNDLEMVIKKSVLYQFNKKIVDFNKIKGI